MSVVRERFRVKSHTDSTLKKAKMSRTSRTWKCLAVQLINYSRNKSQGKCQCEDTNLPRGDLSNHTFIPLISFPAIQQYRPGSMKKCETIEKNTLPTKEEIEAEKKAAAAAEWTGIGAHPLEDNLLIKNHEACFCIRCKNTQEIHSTIFFFPVNEVCLSVWLHSNEQ